MTRRSAVSTEVEGVDEVRRALRKFEGGTADLKAAHAEAAKDVADTAKTIAPTGETQKLVGSIRSSGQAGQGVVRAGKKAVPYAGPIHFGWAAHGIAPNPFLYEAADRRADEVRERFVDALNELVREAGLGTAT